jgi:hypothetical protein
MNYKPRFGPGKNTKCWCGSGKKAKNCHGQTADEYARHHRRKAIPAQAPAVPPKTAKAAMNISQKPWGVPGEDHQLWVVPVMKGEQAEKSGEKIRNTPGWYKVQLLLSRPGYPFTAEREHKFIDDIVGDSHVVIAKPVAERKTEDADRIQLQATGHGKQITFNGLPNDKGYLGKLVVEKIAATGFDDAAQLVYECLAPFLSAWALHLDIPVHVETIQVTNLETHTHSLRVRTPAFEMTFAGGLSPVLTDEFCEYASLYREGMNTNSTFYRFLCFYKIIESLNLRRGRLNEAAKKAGQPVNRPREIMPSTEAELLVLLKEVYPWRQQWDTMALGQILPQEAMGKRLNGIREKYLNPLRVGIAHALLKSGEIRIILDKLQHIQEVNKWLPLCRILARIMMHHEFPTEFGFAMKPLFFGRGTS